MIVVFYAEIKAEESHENVFVGLKPSGLNKINDTDTFLCKINLRINLWKAWIYKVVSSNDYLIFSNLRECQKNCRLPSPNFKKKKLIKSYCDVSGWCPGCCIIETGGIKGDGDPRILPHTDPWIDPKTDPIRELILEPWYSMPGQKKQNYIILILPKL